MTDWFLYMIRTNQGHLYTGITTDVARRFSEHQQGKVGAKYLRSKGPLTLVYQIEIGERSLTAKVEYAIKKLPKSCKESIVEQQLNRKALLNILQLQSCLL
ncbi:MAG: GIY-YIG nuclease family protein [Cyanobacteria bacterium P01_F01_bin.150]